uniref:Putative short-chain dehydrogenase/reductase family 42E member 2 n=1 Tax=Gouania willdenowi TaxID=441366 RepID=A0A8C5D156_GOUWI
MHAVVTGGGGYFGFRLGRALAREGWTVILLDMNKPTCDLPDRAIFHQSDIRDYSSLYKVCDGVDCVFHTASYGMSGPEQLRKEQVESINVGGTQNVINVCKERSISRLVYTSTINVVFTGKPIKEGDEKSIPFVPLDVHIDNYSRTKAIAEQMVLSANGCSLKDEGLLRTCVLRPSGIYGPGERRHLHRVNVERRLFSFSFGDPHARMNWVHVDNLVQAHTLAAQALTSQRSCVASGQAYFINDGTSVNLFEWFTPLVSFTVVLSKENLQSSPHRLSLLCLNGHLSKNIAVTHTFKIDKARKELGYCPKPYSLMDSVEQYLKVQKPPTQSHLINSCWSSQLHVLLLLLFGLTMVLLIYFCVLN